MHWFDLRNKCFIRSHEKAESESQNTQGKVTYLRNQCLATPNISSLSRTSHQYQETRYEHKKFITWIWCVIPLHVLLVVDKHQMLQPKPWGIHLLSMQPPASIKILSETKKHLNCFWCKVVTFALPPFQSKSQRKFLLRRSHQHWQKKNKP